MTKSPVLFLRMGFVSFGGPIAAMAMLEEEFAIKRDWITPAHFAEIYTVLKLCPGPLSTQMAIYIGKLRGGKIGGFIAGILLHPAGISHASHFERSLCSKRGSAWFRKFSGISARRPGGDSAVDDFNMTRSLSKQDEGMGHRTDEHSLSFTSFPATSRWSSFLSV